MNLSMKKFFEKYRTIRDQIDTICSKLHTEHKAHTICKKGCSECCMNFNVFPVEFHSILSEIKTNESIKLSQSNEGCLFLVEHSCTIYEMRPSICRSHGLPILNMDSEGENWELSFCQLNFTNVDEEYFTLENGFQQDVFNSELYLLNRDFIANFKEVAYDENELIELRELKKYL